MYPWICWYVRAGKLLLLTLYLNVSPTLTICRMARWRWRSFRQPCSLCAWTRSMTTSPQLSNSLSQQCSTPLTLMVCRRCKPVSTVIWYRAYCRGWFHRSGGIPLRLCHTASSVVCGRYWQGIRCDLRVRGGDTYPVPAAVCPVSGGYRYHLSGVLSLRTTACSEVIYGSVITIGLIN